MQPGFGLHLKPLERKACEGAEALAAGLVTDPDRQHINRGGLELRPYRHQGLGIFEAVEITQLGEQEHQPAAALPHSLQLRQPLQQHRWGRHSGHTCCWVGHREGSSTAGTIVARARNASAAVFNRSRRAGSIRCSNLTIIERRGLV